MHVIHTYTTYYSMHCPHQPRSPLITHTHFATRWYGLSQLFGKPGLVRDVEQLGWLGVTVFCLRTEFNFSILCLSTVIKKINHLSKPYQEL